MWSADHLSTKSPYLLTRVAFGREQLSGRSPDLLEEARQLVNFLCWLLFWCPFHFCAVAEAYRRSPSFCQKCRWQITAHHHHMYPLAARVIEAPQMISQPVSSIFPCSLLPSGAWWIPDLSIPWSCLCYPGTLISYNWAQVQLNSHLYPLTSEVGTGWLCCPVIVWKPIREASSHATCQGLLVHSQLTLPQWTYPWCKRMELVCRRWYPHKSY